MNRVVEPTIRDSKGEEIVVALVRKTQGRRGEVAAEILTDFPDRFKSLKRVHLVKADGTGAWKEIESFWFHKQAVILKFSGIDTISDAEAWTDAEVRIPKEEAVPLKGNSFYLFELMGCAVIDDASGRRIGRVIAVSTDGGQVLLTVEADDGEKLIPFVEEICCSIDPERQVIRIRPPQGLLELNA